MKKKAILCIMAAALCLSCGMTAYASPETMPDGTLFDAVYYAVTYPDVAAAVGTDKNALYQHYVSSGREEGRNAISPETNLNATSTWWRTKEEAVPDGDVVVRAIDGIGWVHENWNEYSEERKLEYLYEWEQWVKEGIIYDDDAADVLSWWVNTSFDDNNEGLLCGQYGYRV